MNNDEPQDVLMSREDRFSAAIKRHREALAANPNMPHRELAQREAELYACSTPESRNGCTGMADWIGAFIDKKYVNDSALRSRLYARGAAADPFWKLIDGEERMPLRTGVKLMKNAKVIAATTGHTLEEAVTIVLSEYLRSPPRREPNGTQSRRMEAVNRLLVRVGKGEPTRAPEPELEPAPPRRKSRGTTATGARSGDTRMAFADMRKLVKAIVTERLVDYGAEPHSAVVTNAVHDVGIELEAFLSALGNVLLRGEREIKSELPAISRRALNEAFRVLNLEPPKPKEKIDLKRVLKQKQRMAALYHPDAHGGDRATEPQYNAVIDAYGVIRDFVNQQQKN